MRELTLSEQYSPICLPPNTTHRLQPLDVGCFRTPPEMPGRKNPRGACQDGEGGCLKDVVASLHGCETESIQKGNHSPAWRKAGILNAKSRHLYDAGLRTKPHNAYTLAHTILFPRTHPGFFDDPSSDDSSYHPDKELDNSNSRSDSSSESSSSNSNMELALTAGSRPLRWYVATFSDPSLFNSFLQTCAITLAPGQL